jgi:hypothetical protein
VNGLSGRHFPIDGIEEADELLVAVTLHAAADHGRSGPITPAILGSQVELAVLSGVDWWNHTRLPSAAHNLSPAECGLYCRKHEAT